jgi:hypothetical protein
MRILGTIVRERGILKPRIEHLPDGKSILNLPIAKAVSRFDFILK